MNFLFHPAQRGAHRGDLRHDVDAIALVLDHAGEPAHLAFDAVESFAALPSCHPLPCVLYIPLGGIRQARLGDK